VHIGVNKSPKQMPSTGIEGLVSFITSSLIRMTLWTTCLYIQPLDPVCQSHSVLNLCDTVFHYPTTVDSLSAESESDKLSIHSSFPKSFHFRAKTGTGTCLYTGRKGVKEAGGVQYVAPS